MKFAKIKHTIYFLLLYSFTILANTYYVDSNNGSDLNSGLSIETPWKSIYKINQSLFSPGDSILLKSDCIWREELVIPPSGSENNAIIIGSYGTGKFPKIMGSQLLNNILEIYPNIWESQINSPSDWLWFIESDEKINWGNKKESKSELISNFDFYVENNSIAFYCERNLISKIKVEASVRDFGIISGWYAASKNNIIIENLEVCFTKNANIRQIGGTGWIIKNITSHHSGGNDESEGQGIQLEGKNNLITSCRIYENGQHGIFISSFGNHDVKNNIIEKSIIFNNYHTGIDLMNDGGDQNSHLNTIIRRNFIFDEKSFTGNEVGIQTLAYGEGYIKNVTIHHNILRDVNGIGISIVSNSDSLFIHNNTIYETMSANISIANKDGFTEVFNNIGVNNNYYAVLFLHNIENKILNNNVWFTKKNSRTKNIFALDNYYDSIEEYQSKFGFDKNGSFSDPELIISNGSMIGLSKESICIDSGRNLKYKKDYFENETVGNMDVGAIEFIK